MQSWLGSLLQLLCFLWETSPHLFLSFDALCCKDTLTVDMISPNTFPTFAAMPSLAKAVFCHIWESVTIWIYPISLAILEYPLSWAAPSPATPANLIIFNVHSSHMILLPFQCSWFCLFRLTFGISCHPLPWSRPPSLLPGGPQRKV